ncbi:unnamed protein product [Caenorhabditis nigoni]
MMTLYEPKRHITSLILPQEVRKPAPILPASYDHFAISVAGISFVKKERVQEENVYRKVYAVKRRKLREDSEEAASSDASRRFNEDSEATTSEVKSSTISKYQENTRMNFKQQNSANRIHKIPKVIPNDQNVDQTEEVLHKEEEIQNLKRANPEGQTPMTMVQANGNISSVLEEIQNLPESPKKSGPIYKKVPDSEVAKKVQDLEDLKVEVPVSEDAVPKKRNNPGYYIPKNDPIYDERMAVLRARYAGILDEVKMSDGLAKILVDDHQLVNLGKKVPRIPVEWTVVKILEEYKKANDADSYILLKNIIPRYFDENFRSLLYKVEIPIYKKSVIEEAARQNLVFKASENCGFIHLLRLITKIHKFVMMDNSVHNLEKTRSVLIEFTKFLESKKDIFYIKVQDYVNT